MCPGCRALVAVGTPRCGYCGWDLELTETRRRGGLVQRFFRGPGGVTRALVTANIVVAVVTAVASVVATRAVADVPVGPLLLGGVWSPGTDALLLLGGAAPGLMAAGEIHRFAAAVFLHGGILHLGMNMMALRQVGPLVEEAWGSGKMLAVYLLCGLAGTAARLLWSGPDGPDAGVPSVGASGAIVGLFGVLAAFGLRIGGERGRELFRAMVEPVAFILVLGIVLEFRGGGIQLDNAAHAGGFLAGLAAGFATSFGVRSRGSVAVVRAWDLGATALAGLFAASLLPGIAALAHLAR